MGRIALFDDGLPYDGRTAETAPLGGAESSVISLAEAFAARGRDVVVYNRCETPVEHKGVAYRRLGEDPGADIEHVIVNRSARLLCVLTPRRRATLWLHNDARYLQKARHAWPLLRFNPARVVLSRYHARTVPGAFRCGATHTIPLGVSDWFRRARRASAPPPRAVFASNPERGLDELLSVWESRIHPHAPEAELHLFTRAEFYGVANKAAQRAEPVISRAKALRGVNVHVHDLVPRRTLAELYRDMRVMLYWGDDAHAETFCLSAAEAQAAGLPSVARPIGAMSERIAHGRTGFLERNADSFAQSAITLLTDDAVWQRCHAGAVDAPAPDWNAAAAQFEALHAGA